MYFGWGPTDWVTMTWAYFSARVAHMNERRRTEAADANSAAFQRQMRGATRNP